MNKFAIGFGGVLAVALALGCAGRGPGPRSGSLPPRQVLGEGVSPLDALAGDAPQQGSASRVQHGWNGLMEGLASELARSLRWDGHDRMKVAVLDFVETHGRECSLGSPAAEDLTTNLFSTNKFEIIERRMLERVLEENQASQSDLYDPEHVARLGGLLGADGIVTGTVTASQHGYSFNTRVILVESGGVASAARVELSRQDVDGRGTCGDGRTIIAAPPM